MNVLNSKIYLKDLDKAVTGCNFDNFYHKSFFVAGGLGLIGSSVVDLLYFYNQKYNAQMEIYVGARNEQKFEERYGDCSGIYFFKYDALSDFDVGINFDYIIYCAGLSSPELYVKNPVEVFLSNVNGVQTLLNFIKTGKTRFLYVSSSEVYGLKNTDAVFCEGQYGVINLDSIRSSYPIAKQASEMLCKSYESEYGVDTVIVRPGHIFGPSASFSDRRIATDFIFKSAFGKNLSIKSAGLQKRSYCYCVDCALAILIVLLNGKRGESYNVGGNDIITIREMAEIVAQSGKVLLDTVEPLETEKQAFNPMNNSALDISKLCSIGFVSKFSAKDGLEHSVEIVKELSSISE